MESTPRPGNANGFKWCPWIEGWRGKFSDLFSFLCITFYLKNIILKAKALKFKEKQQNVKALGSSVWIQIPTFASYGSWAKLSKL